MTCRPLGEGKKVQSGQTAFETSLSNFVREVRNIADLSAVRERTLCRAWRDRNDVSAAEELIRSQRQLVLQTAGAYSGCGLPWDEVIIEAHIGLMRAACRFDPDRDVRFASSASWWVEAAVQDLVVRNWSRVILAGLPVPRTGPKVVSGKCKDADQYRETNEPAVVPAENGGPNLIRVVLGD
jgi:DNA-directed RNA polymerase sigma subunit (sigma70/sigma32)